MSKEIIKNAISVYIQEEKSDYAIMLNGAWGSGKTYFVKNELIDYLQDRFDRNVLYISLFGISNIDELYNNIALQVLNIKATETLDQKIKMNNPSYNNSNKKTIFERSKISLWTGILNKGLKIIPDNNVINSVVSEVNKNIISFNKYIFVFDDLERSTLNFDVLLGFFDQITDQNEIKAILICNENEIDAINEKYYKKFKEKVIGLTIDYKSDINKDFDSIIDTYLDNEDCKKYAIEEKGNILGLFNRGDTSNLRTLIFIFKRFKEMYNKVLKIYEPWDTEKQYLDKFIREILLAIVGSSILIKDKHQNNDFKEEKRIISYIDINENKKEISNLGASYLAYKFVDEYLIKYNFDENEIENIITEFLIYERYDVNKVISKINDIFDEDNDEAAVNKFEKILKLIEDNNLNINIYPRILDEVFILIKHLFNEEKIEEIKIIIKENAKKRAKEFSSFSWSTFPYTDHEAKEFKCELFDLLKKEKKENFHSEWINIFIDKKNFINNFDEYVLKNFDLFKQENITLAEIGVNKIFECIKDLSIRELRIFRGDLNYIFDKNSNNLKDFKFFDKKLIGDLKEKIKSDLLTGNKKTEMQKLELNFLCKTLDKILFELL